MARNDLPIRDKHGRRVRVFSPAHGLISYGHDGEKAYTRALDGSIRRVPEKDGALGWRATITTLRDRIVGVR